MDSDRKIAGSTINSKCCNASNKVKASFSMVEKFNCCLLNVLFIYLLMG